MNLPSVLSSYSHEMSSCDLYGSTYLWELHVGIPEARLGQRASDHGWAVELACAVCPSHVGRLQHTCAHRVLKRKHAMPTATHKFAFLGSEPATRVRQQCQPKLSSSMWPVHCTVSALCPRCLPPAYYTRVPSLAMDRSRMGLGEGEKRDRPVHELASATGRATLVISGEN